jgi:hypothetical protein
MALTPEQHSQIAVTYESAANDESLPMQQRRAFAKKANWFRMVARVAAKKQEAEAVEGFSKKRSWKASD